MWCTLMSGWLDSMEIWLIKPCYYNFRNSHSIVNTFLYTLALCPEHFHLFLLLPLPSITEKLTFSFTLSSGIYFLPHFSFISKSRRGTFSLPSTLVLPLDHLCFSHSKLNYLSSLEIRIRLSPSPHHCSAICRLSSYFSPCWRFWSQQYLSVTTFSFLKNSAFVLCWLWVPPPKRWDFVKVSPIALNSFPFVLSVGWASQLQPWPLFKCLSNSDPLLKPSLNYRLEFPKVSALSPSLTARFNKLYQKMKSLFLLLALPLHTFSQWKVVM